MQNTLPRLFRVVDKQIFLALSIGITTVRLDTWGYVLSLTEFSEAVMMCLKLLLYFTHITGSL